MKNHLVEVLLPPPSNYFKGNKTQCANIFWIYWNYIHKFLLLSLDIENEYSSCWDRTVIIRRKKKELVIRSITFKTTRTVFWSIFSHSKWLILIPILELFWCFFSSTYSRFAVLSRKSGCYLKIMIETISPTNPISLDFLDQFTHNAKLAIVLIG